MFASKFFGFLLQVFGVINHSTVTIGIEFFESNINAYYTTVVWHRLRVIFHIKNYKISP